jgi:hypothetical protein
MRPDKEMATKGKSRSRNARTDIMKANAKQATRKARTTAQARQQRPGKAGHYIQSDYDTPQSEES